MSGMSAQAVASGQVRFLYCDGKYSPVGRMIRLICSMFSSSGLNPPCMQRIFSSTIAETGKQLKQSVKVFHSFILYLLLPTVLNYMKRDRRYSAHNSHSS